MTKAIIKMGYKNFVLDAEKALQVLALMEDAEIYESKWHGSDRPEGEQHTYHIYSQEFDGLRTMEVLPSKLYQMAKLAGKP
jgi:hypothetical protein